MNPSLWLSRDPTELKCASGNECPGYYPSPDGRWLGIELGIDIMQQYAIMPFTMDAEPFVIPGLSSQSAVSEMVWSPDSRHALFEARENNQNDLYDLDVESDFRPKRLTNTPDTKRKCAAVVAGTGAISRWIASVFTANGYQYTSS